MKGAFGRAFTVVEILTCLAIIAIVMAIATPAFIYAKKSAQISGSMSNLHQMFLAGKLYQMGWDGEGKYGDIDLMGLPSAKWPDFGEFIAPLPKKTPCGLDPGFTDEGRDGPLIYDYWYRPGDGGQQFAAYAAAWRENMLFFADSNCGDHSKPFLDQALLHRGLGVLLSGQALNLQRRGSMVTDNHWWSEPEP